MVRQLIICITGLPGAGKTTVAETLKSSGFQIISMGDVVREEAKREGVAPNDVNLGRIMLNLRAKYGEGAIAHLLLEKLESSPARYIVIDGVRSFHEVQVLKKHLDADIKVLAIHAPKESRFTFLKERGRSDAPTSDKEFEERDKRELGVGIGEAISFSDHIITNDGSIDDLKKKALDVVQRWKDEFKE